MDDFAKMMGDVGVRRLGERPEPARRSTGRTTPGTRILSVGKTHDASSKVPEAAPAAVAEPVPADLPAVAWALGRAAADTIQRALARCLVERGRIALLVREEGCLAIRPARLHATIGELAVEADAADAELVIIEGPGWKTIMHPASGVATLTEDPTD